MVVNNTHRIKYSNYTGIEFIESNRIQNFSNHFDKLIVDLRDLSFLRPLNLVSLACLIEEYYQKNTEIEFLMPEKNSDLYQYLTNIRFIEYWEEGFNRDEFTQTHIDTNLCLWHISKILINQYAIKAQRYYEQNYFNGFDLQGLYVVLGEIFNNIFDHSNSVINGYVITQYYPKKKKIVTSVCDFGVGIPNKLNSYWEEKEKDRMPDTKALEIALRKNISTKSTPHNKGLGLDLLCSITKSLLGSVSIISNFATYNLHPTGKETYKKNNFNFAGTLISVELDTRELLTKELEITDENYIF